MTNRDDGFRYLGFAFASADLLFEINDKDVITFALGAARRVTGSADVVLLNNSWRVMFEPSDHGLLSALFSGLSGAARKGPVRCRLKEVPGRPARYANVYACRLPQLAPNISCALSLGREGFANEAENGLMDRQAFDEAIGRLMADARDSGLDVELALIEVAGMAKAVKLLSDEDAENTIDSVTDVLRAESLRGAATKLEDDRFAILRERPEGPDTLAERLKKAAADVGVDIQPETAALTLDKTGSSQSLRALRFTLDQFLTNGMAADGDMAATFKEGLDGTLRQAKAFSASVKSRNFKLVYQPIVDLGSRAIHHYEALARFPEGDGTFETIRMAEELDIIESFDLAVAEMSIKTLRSHGPEVSIAVNVSGRSFLRPRFLDRILNLTGSDVRLKGRLLFEITESSALANLDLAEERIQRLRRDGFQVCIDDFGAGSASLSYLRSLSVDVVKIDGQFIKGIVAGGRDAVFVRHLASLCQELKVKTIAEMVETQAVADTLKGCGVDLGQGFLFGAPIAKIPTAASMSPRAARRTGAVESWG